MKVQGFIASRLRFRSGLATAAIAVSFLVMIVSLAISGGFRKEIRGGITELTGDILLTGSEEPLETGLSYYPLLEKIRGVESISPVITRPAIVKGPEDIAGVIVKGVSMPDSLSLRATVPTRLASMLKLAEGEKFTVWFIDEKVKARRFTVEGTYEAPAGADEALTIIVPLSDMQRLCDWDAGKAGALEVRLAEGANEDAVASEMFFTALGNHGEEEDIIRPATARQRYPQLFDWLDLIDFNVLTIILLMTVVAGFNMISGLLIMLFRNISTIGILKSLGMGNRAIAGVFLRVAARITATGMLIGNAAALLFCLVQGTTRFIKLNPANYFVSFVPVSVSVPLLVLVNVLSFAAIMLLLLIPTLFISKVDPAETVRVK